MNTNKLIQARSSPFYNAYINQKKLIDSAIDKSIKAGTEEIGTNAASQLFSITTKMIINKEAA